MPHAADDAAKVRKLLRQQSAIADFGSYALRQGDLHQVLTEAARVCARGLGVPYSKICKYRATENDLLIVAGFGWRPGVIGHVSCRADATSPQGRAFSTSKPSICNDLRNDHKFKLPAFYAEHGIVSTVDVLIKGNDKPYGVLEIDNDQQHEYDQHDIDFLTGFANVLAEAVATSTRTDLLQSNIQRMTLLVEEKDRLLEQKRVLSDELQHRVRNNLQLVYGMLSKQLEDTHDQLGQRGIRAIARRVSTLATVYDNLVGTEISRTTDFGAYVKSLCLHLAEFQDSAGSEVTLSCESDPISLDLDAVTALGIIVTELITNSFDHAFPASNGSIVVRVCSAGSDTAVMTISDDGAGFEAKQTSKRHGLGLVKRLAEQLSGSATVDSVLGTLWTVTFPTSG